MHIVHGILEISTGQKDLLQIQYHIEQMVLTVENCADSMEAYEHASTFITRIEEQFSMMELEMKKQLEFLDGLSPDVAEDIENQVKQQLIEAMGILIEGQDKMVETAKNKIRPKHAGTKRDGAGGIMDVSPIPPLSERPKPIPTSRPLTATKPSIDGTVTSTQTAVSKPQITQHSSSAHTSGSQTTPTTMPQSSSTINPHSAPITLTQATESTTKASSLVTSTMSEPSFFILQSMIISEFCIAKNGVEMYKAITRDESVLTKDKCPVSFQVKSSETYMINNSCMLQIGYKDRAGHS